MLRKTTYGMILAASLAGGISAASAQGVTCTYTWCVNQVTVQGGSAALEFPELRMQRQLQQPVMAWFLYGAPDDEFRADSVMISEPDVVGSPSMFPLRQGTPNMFVFDNMNTNNTTYNYEIRVYKQGAPAGTMPVVTKGTFVNLYN